MRKFVYLYINSEFQTHICDNSSLDDFISECEQNIIPKQIQ
jgi:hypothetical protein